MARPPNDSAILTIRVPAKLNRRLEREARRRRQTRSEAARAILQAHFDAGRETDMAHEARRQSLLVSRRRSDRAALSFVQRVSDDRGWR